MNKRRLTLKRTVGEYQMVLSGLFEEELDDEISITVYNKTTEEGSWVYLPFSSPKKAEEFGDTIRLMADGFNEEGFALDSEAARYKIIIEYLDKDRPCRREDDRISVTVFNKEKGSRILFLFNSSEVVPEFGETIESMAESFDNTEIKETCPYAECRQVRKMPR